MSKETSPQIVILGYNMLMNSKEEIKLRKNEYTLKITSMGVVIFGVWSFVKLMLHTAFEADYFESFYDPQDGTFGKIVALIACFLVLAFGLLFRGYIAKNAFREANGIRRKPLYIIYAGLVAVVTCSAMVFNSMNLNSNVDLVDRISAIFIDLTSTAITIEMIVSALYVRKHRKS